ncbi:helix-turn-helix domain-containing protein [Adlercreutzia sp.]|uniref:helix-turn-helix domain-containing protein n=1 Tax=Adlercreutzia sp. TaxID=1872387 RepID=UPI003AB0B407
MDHNDFIVSRIRLARELRGISIAELARRARIDSKRLWYILDGQRQMRADELIRLCAVLGLGLRSFIPPEIEKDLTEQHLQIIRRFKKGS